MGHGDFSLKAVYAALDAKRIARGLTWATVAREISGVPAGTRSVSSSTITGLARRAIAEGDGVLNILVWLERTPESFVAGHADAAAERYRLKVVPAGQVLRFDARALHAALEARRQSRNLTWREVASEIPGHTAAMLTRLADGGRVAFPNVMHVCRWLGEPATTFTHLTLI